MSASVPQWTELELDLMRAGLAYAAVFSIRTSKLMRPDAAPTQPVGVARLIDLGWVGTRRFTDFSQWMVMLAAVVFATGRLELPALATMAVLMLLEVTYLSSHGGVNHGSHLLIVVLVAQCAARTFWSDTMAADAMLESRDATAAWWSIQAMVAVYLTSGLTKLINSRGSWAYLSPRLVLSIPSRRTTDQALGGRRLGASRQARVISAIADNPRWAMLLFGSGLIIELAAPLALVDARVMLPVGIALIAVHIGNAKLLNLPFVGYQILVVTFLINPGQLLN